MLRFVLPYRLDMAAWHSTLLHLEPTLNLSNRGAACDATYPWRRAFSSL